ncbi:MAG: ATP-binding protein [Paraglaciecola polaris]|uniref:ATP-binding protein n=1 Tax=Paraglaciecola polaris TaxID=222814 RepID=UPI003002DE20|tara:strand:+ start:4182 stop:5420 length:1239 start_codon:yes stop_codon:yes gene_type:complete
MARLFISLYVFIVLALVGLSAGLERLFSPASQGPAQHVSTIITLFDSAHAAHLDIRTLADNTGLPYKVVPLTSIGWSTQSAEQLALGKSVLLYDEHLGEQLYIPLDKQTILELNISAQKADNQSLLLYSTIFFVLLGALIALWLWPLWRDLNQLKRSVSHVQDDGSIADNHVSNASLIAPIAQALNTMSVKVKSLLQSQRELSGAVAHEFRTPLARLKFALEARPTLDSPQWHAMAMDVEELERLVQEMLDYAGSDVLLPELNLAEIPLKELVEQVVRHLHTPHLAKHKVCIVGDNVTLLADDHFVQRALENLLINASRYAQYQIRLNISQNANHVLLSVEDDGPGIPHAVQEKIFDAFYRPDEGRTRASGGAGLGLAIVRRIQQWHEGDCWAQDSELGGVKFILRYPRHGL